MSAPEPQVSRPARPHVLIVGGGVAGLETLLALRALAGNRVDVTVLAPETKFINRSMAADQPFRQRRARGVRLEDIASEFGARWHRGVLDRLDPARRLAFTRDGGQLAYDMVVLALGARSEYERDWRPQEVLTYHGGRDGPNFRLLLTHLSEGRVKRLAFVKPAGASWPLPLYDLALMTAARCAEHGHPEVDLRLITPEEEPLAIFGTNASAGVRRLLAESGITLHTSSYTARRRPGCLELSPGRRRLRVDRIVTEPHLVGPGLRGLSGDRDGFIHTDSHGRVPGLDGVFAAGDATDFPIKQGGVAAQQADVVAEAIAAAVGVEIDPQPFRPVLRGLLLTGGPARFLQSDISGDEGDDSHFSEQPLWWPPNKLAGRYLAPYLSGQVGEAADVMPSDQYRDARRGLSGSRS